MCGVLVYFNQAGVSEDVFRLMLKDLSHRGPDASGNLQLESGKLLLGHSRLKIIDFSNHANQPYLSKCGRYSLVFNGEIYNFKELKKQLKNLWQWETNSDTEVLLAAWITWGQSCVEKLNGMFAFAVYDYEKRTISFVRDRFGIKPLYYSKTENSWAFASEIQPLLRLQQNKKANLSTIRTYLETGLYDHCDNTFFSGIYSVNPGSIITIDITINNWVCKRWYHFHKNVPDLLHATNEELRKESELLIENAINSHLVADVEIGLNVSGGVDSSMLTRTAIDSLGPVHLFTQDYEGYSELQWVNEIVEGGHLHIANLGPSEIEGWLQTTNSSQGEPFGGIFVCGYNSLYNLARKLGVTVLLDGNGVDEIFLGYKRYHQLYVQSAETELEMRQRQEDFFSFWGEKIGFSKVGGAIDGTSGLRPDALSQNLLSVSPLSNVPNFVEEFEDPVRQIAAQDLLHNKIPRGLRFNDRVSMASSCELRVPFLDHRLVEFAFGIPTNKLLTKNGTKYIFRDLLARKTKNPNLAFSIKRSVQSPQREWFCGVWKSWVDNIITSESFRDRGWVDVDKAKKIFSDYLNGNNKNSFFIWQWVNLELWSREFLD